MKNLVKEEKVGKQRNRGDRKKSVYLHVTRELTRVLKGCLRDGDGCCNYGLG